MLTPREAEDALKKLQGLSPESFDLPYANDLLDHLRTRLLMVAESTLRSPHDLARVLIVSGARLSDSTLPATIAQLLFGDPRFVFDVARHLHGERHVSDALWGSPDGYEPFPRETLIGFLNRVPGGVVIFDDLQAFDPSAIYGIASMCEDGWAQSLAGRQGVHLNAVVLVTARVSLPSPREIENGRRLEEWNFDWALSDMLEKRHPEHLSRWVHSRFHLLLSPLWRCYQEATAGGRADEPLLVVPDTVVWAGEPDPPQPAPHEMVDDVQKAIPKYEAGKHFDVFVSYRHRRNARSALWLARQLKARNVSVWVDEDFLGAPGRDPGRDKASLIAGIVKAVRASRCTIAFAIGAEPYVRVEGIDDDEAVRRGLAMPYSGGTGTLIKWSWQTLELKHSEQGLVIYEASIEDLRGETRGAFDTDERMLEVVLEYLRELGISA